MKVSDLAQLLGGKMLGEGSRELRGVASLESAAPDEVAFAEGSRALGRAATSRAGCILVPEGVSFEGRTTVAVLNPKLAFIHAAEALHLPVVFAPERHLSAVIAPEAELASDVSVGAHVVVEKGARVGAGTRLSAGVFLGESVQVGRQCVIHPRVTVYPGARIGNRVILHAGVVVGSEGFGYVYAQGQHLKFPQMGQVIIEDDVEIGSNTTVDRGSLGFTVIGQGTKIDNLVQVAHNVKIGRHCIIAAQTGISGSVVVGDNVVMGGQVGIGDHARILDHAVLGGGAGILPGKVVQPGTTVWGRPARPLAEFKRMYAHLSNLPRLAEKVKALGGRQPQG